MDHRLLYVTATMLLAAALPAAVAAQGRPNPGVGVALGSPDVAVEPADDAQTTPATLYVAMARSLARDADSDYGIDSRGHGANPRHGFKLAFSPEGMRVVGADGDLILRLTRFGRGDGEPVRRTMPRIEGAWVAYDRGPGLKEWFVNSPRGVEQGWTVSKRPAGEGPLTLEIDTGRELEESHTGHFAGSGIVYHGLVAFDAEGRELPSLWAHNGIRLRIEVDDAAAVYPVVIDPWVQQDKLTATDGGPFDRFGDSVALSGDTALVGSPGATVDGKPSQGAAYVFVRSADDWIEQARLTSSEGAEGDAFGVAVAVSGDIALVGAETAILEGNTGQGAAYVFVRDGTGWSQRAILTPSSGDDFDSFGQSVALSGSIALVGAASATVGADPGQGAVYVYSRSSAGWSEEAKLVATDGDGEDTFGASVSISGTTALVGSPRVDVGDNFDQGAAYVFTRSGGSWSQQIKLIAADGKSGDLFGTVALSGDTALVGAREADIGKSEKQGAAYLFVRVDGLWSQNAKLTADDGQEFDRFGSAVGLSGDVAMVGVSRATIGENAEQGAVYVFTRGAAGWSPRSKLIALDGGEFDRFGSSVAVSSDTAVVGAPFANDAYTFVAPLSPVGLAVDADSQGSNGNGIFEPGELVETVPAWRNNADKTVSVSGTAVAFSGPGGATYSLVDDDADYGMVEPGASTSCMVGSDCFVMHLNFPPTRPATHWEAMFEETLSDTDSNAKTWTLHIGNSFSDVPQTSLFYPWIETLLHHGVTSGCAASAYCPADLNTRSQISVFLLKAAEGSDYLPPGCVEGEGLFVDVPFDSPFCPWIHALAGRGVTGGCGGSNYCPNASVSRAQMSVFLLKALEGPEYMPPQCDEVFDDVPCPSLFANWIEDLVAREITAGCGDNNYCPASPVSRSQMAVFLVKTFKLMLYGP